MNLKKSILCVVLGFTVVFPSSAYAADQQVIQLHGGYNYVEQYQENWCWAATGLNAFVAIDEEVPSNKSDRAFLLELVKDFVDNSDIYFPVSGNSDYVRYDIRAGLTATAEIATKLLRENGYRRLRYEVSTDNKGRETTRDFDYIMSDLEYGCPVAIWLEPTPRSTNNYHHIVLIIGADSTWNNPDDYDVKIFDSQGGKYKWVKFDDLCQGDAESLNYKKYTGTCEYQGRF